MTTLDFSARFAVEGSPGIAWRLLGYVTEPEDDWSGCVRTDETMVRAVMVGDDRIHEIDVDDLREIAEDSYCPECGQIGCGHGR